MKKFSLVALGLLALGIAAPASAADLRVKAPPPAPIVTVYNWSGFYIGANGGWARSRNCFDIVTVTGAFLDDGCRDRSGGVLGGQLGFRWQTGGFVFGLEAQGDWADISSSHTSLINPLFVNTAKTDAIGLFTGQIGWAWDAALLYVKGGAAVTKNDFDIDTIGGINVVSASATRWGATVGVGFEYGFAPNWSAGIEYNHLFMGDSNNSFTVVNPLFVGVGNRINQDIDMVTLRVNYRFGGPAITRY